MTYKEARVYLDEVSKYGSVLGLDMIRSLLAGLADPQKDLRVIHIAGTNGKGSVLAYISTILQEAGFRVGRYVSPAVISELEKIQVNGCWILEEEFAELVEQVQKAVARMETDGKGCPTVFEIETAMAFLYFKKKHCDVVVLETGLGGRLDATNVVERTVLAVFTEISRDHMGILGGTLEEIAGEKAGIIKPGCIVVSAWQEPAVKHVLARYARQCGCPYIFADPHQAYVIEEDFRGQTVSYKDMKEIRAALPGVCQLSNVAVAVETVGALAGMEGWKITQQAVRSGFAKTVWPGRFTCICEKPLFFIDGAHNAAAARYLAESLRRYFHGRRILYILGVFRDKEYEKIAEVTAPLASKIFTINLPDKERTLRAEVLKKVLENTKGMEGKVHVSGDVKQAVEDAIKEAGERDVILAFGSLSYLGQVIHFVQEREIQ